MVITSGFTDVPKPWPGLLVMNPTHTGDMWAHLVLVVWAGCYVALGFVSGAVRILDASSLHGHAEDCFHFSDSSITHITFSLDSMYLATAVSRNILSIYFILFIFYVKQNCRKIFFYMKRQTTTMCLQLSSIVVQKASHPLHCLQVPDCSVLIGDCYEEHWQNNTLNMAFIQ